MQNDWTPEKAALQGIKNALYRVAVRKNPSKDATLLKDTLEKFLQLWKMEEEKGGVCVALSPTQEKELGVQIMEDFGLAYNVSGYSGNPHRNFGIPAIPFLIDRSEKKQTRLYSHTNFFHEALLGRKLIQLASRKVEIRPESKKLADYFKSQDIYDRPNKEQLQAIQKALSNNLSIISGGPGTGKTSSVVRILEALLEGQPEAKIYVTAPTGKAKSRLIESLIERPKIFPNVGRAYKDNRLLANTIHMWLSSPTDEGSRPDETHCLECDILVIDEASMIDSEIAFNLFNVIDTKKTRVIVLGDMYQLAAVGPGAVYADISSPDNALKGILTELKESHRFKGSSGIGSLSKLINQNTADEENQISEILSLLNNHGPLIQKNGKAGSATTEDIFLSTDLKLNPKTALTSEAEKWIAENMGRYAEAVQDILLSENGAEEKELENLWHVLNSFKPIAAVRKGPMSVQAVNNYCQKLLLSRLHYPDNSSEFYPGKVIIVRKNDLSLGVSNGDIAIIFEDKEIPGQWNAYIGDTKKILKAQLLPEYDVGFCITVHQSQGSGYDNIGVFMPFIEGDNAENTQAIGLATRELLYTAVTRAKTSCWIFSSIEVLSRSIRTRTKRNGGLAYRLKEFSITAPKPPVTENLLLDL
uniref:ATP-dependent DNA helicase n=1 Tax=Turicimonas muris TaxID=1796652 RepID=UPI00402A8E4F